MVIILILVYLCLLAKDTIPIGDPYVLRGFSQFIALLGGFWLLFRSGKRVGLKKYLPLILYFVSIAISAVLSEEALYSCLQVLSLGAALFFFVTYIESPGEKALKNVPLEKVVIYAGIIVCLLSFVAAAVAPSLAYQYMISGGIYRFRGVFGQPSALAANAGIISGLILFGKHRWFVKLPLASVAIAALIWSSARTFWIGWLAAAVCVIWWISRNNQLKLLSLAGFALLLGFLAIQAGIVDSAGLAKGFKKATRMESIDNLTGRVGTWEKALFQFTNRPFFGYGFGVGDEAFMHRPSVALDRMNTPSLRVRYTLHNGYIQALLDSGLFGCSLYMLVVGKSLLALLALGDRKYAKPLFVVVFMFVANLGETVMFTAAVAHSVLGWYYVVFALSLTRKKTNPTAQQMPFEGERE